MTDYQEQNHPEPEPLTSSNSDFVKRYVGAIALITVALIIFIFWGFNSRQTKLLKEQMVQEARAFFQEIVQTRHWIISQEGVYVKKKPGMLVDPVLEQIEGLESSIRDDNGQIYLLRSHAAITRMISAKAAEERLFGINITSLKPIGPSEPDSFEREALQSFEKGGKENFRFEETPTGVLFRYMAPLITEEVCLKCHAQQGHKVGDIRGGISITIPATQLIREINETRIYVIISALVLLTTLLLLKLYIAKRFISALDNSKKRLIELATTDPLTGLLNRREGIRQFQQEISRSVRENQPLSVILLDIDFFKQINDNFGHQVGDDAIKMVSLNLVATLRDYDIVCRYGGEEFLVILPATDPAKAVATAERVREVIEQAQMKTQNGKEFKLTISSGVSTLRQTDSLDSLVYRADNALYISKEEGRNQVQYL